MKVEHKRLALLIDSENISAKYMPIISEELEKQGTVTYKRIYGDWNNSQTAKWREKVAEYALTPVQQFRNTVGKNAIDSALIIDAMDILYTGNVEGFCIVSSDSDFTRLVNRLRESGMMVIGMGEEKSIHSFRIACNLFINLQSIEEKIKVQDFLETEVLTKTKQEIAIAEEVVMKKEVMRIKETPGNESSNLVEQHMIEQEVISIIQKNENKGKVTELGEVGSRLSDQYPNFKVKKYGYSTLSDFLSNMNDIEMSKVGPKVIVKVSNGQKKDASQEKICAYVKQLLRSNKAKTMELGTLGRYVHNKFKNFDVKKVGYSKLSTFIKSIEGVEIKEERSKKSRRQMVYIQR